VSVGGNHAEAMNNRGIATVAGKERPFTHEDVDRAIEGAQSLSLPTNREVLHVIPRSYIADGQEQVSDPVGMFGHRLDVDTHIVTGSVTAIQNLTQCVESAGVQVEALVFSPLAAAEAVLLEEEKEQGVVLVDIGGGTTEVAVFVDGTVFYTSVLPVGGYHLTRDLGAGLRAPFSQVEEIKISHGSALPSQIDAEETVELQAFGGHRTMEVPKRRIAEILQARVEEILEMVYIDVKRAGFDEMIAAGLVLCGGTANLQGFVELSELVLHMPVRTGVPRRIHGLADTLTSPSYATSVGLLHWAMNDHGHNGDSNGHKLRLPAFELSGALASLQQWFKNLMPH
jgi:cell division protein FtsA